jgi:hypothetical protein
MINLNELEIERNSTYVRGFMGMDGPTPLKLCVEQIDKIPCDYSNPHQKWFFLAAGHGTYAIVAYHKFMEGLSKIFINETERSRHILKNMLYLNEINPWLCRNLLKEGFQNIIEEDFIEFEMHMKFDVILGNPPYNWSDGENQRRNNRENLWTRFVFKSWDLLNDGGYLNMITPKSWMSPSADFGKRKIYKEIFTDGNPIYVNIDECKRHFNVGSTFSYYIVQKDKNCKKTKVKTENSEFEFDFTSVDSLPVEVNDIILSISNKFFSIQDKFDFNQMGITTRGEEFLKEPEGEYLNPTYHTNSKPLLFSRHISQDMNDPKILICLSGMYEPIIDVNGDISHTAMSCVYKVGNGENIHNHALLLNHKIYRYIMNVLFKYNGWVNMNIVKRLPKINVDYELTNDTVYSLFNLTEEEINHIESNVN